MLLEENEMEEVFGSLTKRVFDGRSNRWYNYCSGGALGGIILG